tara:strand:- start:2033 stop:4174 length:2142 start_codon:yes stop_codon:yes gene_type:complete
MSQTKAQLLAPIGVVTAPGLTVTGVTTATSFDGNVTGTASSIVQGSNIIVGVMSATGFAGDFTGTATGINTSSNLNVGVVTALSFVGDVTGNLTGSAGGLSGGGDIHVGVVTSAAMSGDGSNLTGVGGTPFTAQIVPGTTYSIDVTNSGSGAYTLSGTDRNGSVSGNNASVTVEIGDTLNFVVDASGHPFYIKTVNGTGTGNQVTTPAATNQGAQSGTVSWTPNTAGTYYYNCSLHASMNGTITVTATTTIDLSKGNNIVFNQTANTTVSFANTSTTQVISITFPNATGNISWPDSIKWNGGDPPTLLSSPFTNDWNVLKLLTRDAGVSWKGWEEASYDGSYYAYVTGSNTYGQLGLNNRTTMSSPTQLGAGYKGARGCHIFQYGSSYTKTDGTLWSSGAGYFGNLGLNQPHTTFISSPTQVGSDRTWDKLTKIHKHTCCLKTDNSLWTWGNNEFGELGLNQPQGSAYSSPTQMPGNWKSAMGAYYCTAAIKTDGTMWTWGYNGLGGLAQNDVVTRSSPVQIPGTWLHTAGVSYQSMAVTDNGSLYSWGYNRYGSLGQNQGGPASPNYSSPVQISHGFAHTPFYGWSQNANSMVGTTEGAALALKADGTMWSWGNGGNGALGQNDNTNRSSPTQVGTISPTLYWTHLVQSGWTTIYGIKNDNTLWGWGHNGSGQMGLNNRTNYSSPIQIPGDWYMKDGQICADAYGTLWRKAD